MASRECPEEIIRRAQENDTYQLWLQELRRCAPAYHQIWHTLTPEEKTKVAAYQSAQEELTRLLLQIAYNAGQENHSKAV